MNISQMIHTFNDWLLVAMLVIVIPPAVVSLFYAHDDPRRHTIMEWPLIICMIGGTLIFMLSVIAYLIFGMLPGEAIVAEGAGFSLALLAKTILQSKREELQNRK